LVVGLLRNYPSSTGRFSHHRRSAWLACPRRRAKLTLEGVGPIRTAEIKSGRVTILYGPNASGKTTVARVLEQVIKMLSGGGMHRGISLIVNRESRV